MNKFLIGLLSVIPSFLIAFSAKEISQSAIIKQRFQADEPVFIKGNTSQGTELVEKVWHIIKHHRWTAVRNRMDSHFSGVDPYGNIRNRKEELRFLKALDIESTEVFVLKVTAPNDEVLVVQYVVNITVETLSNSVVLPGMRMSVFKKKNHKWLWSSDSDLNFFLDTPTT